MEREFRYFGLLFRQREDAPEAVLFIAPAEEIGEWAGVPRKSSAFMKGFQRAIDEKHVEEIVGFFQESENISPTAIVVAFKPQKLRIEPLEMDEKTRPREANWQPVLISIKWEELKDTRVDVLAEGVVEILKKELPNSDYYEKDEDEIDEDEENGDEEDDLEEISNQASEFSVGHSHLRKFIKNLESREWLENSSKEDEPKLREMLIDLLKPGTIVDGQHRTRGAAFLERQIPFPVVGLVDASWKEEVFQFVVINQRAKPIESAFLSAIISSSLSEKDIEELKSRLEQAGVDLRRVSR